ncbi:MAG: amphi-Trp domain-containing protein, partial [Planctomycetota bacterium]
DRETIGRHLQALIEGIQQGRIRLGSGDEEIVLEPDGLLNLEVHARRKDRQMRLTVRIEWNADSGRRRSQLVIRPDKDES